MSSEMQLVITDNKQVIKTVATATNTQALHLVKSLQEFQSLVNATLTKLIEETGGSNQEDNEELGDDDSDEDDDPAPASPKKKRK